MASGPRYEPLERRHRCFLSRRRAVPAPGGFACAADEGEDRRDRYKDCRRPHNRIPSGDSRRVSSERFAWRSPGKLKQIAKTPWVNRTRVHGTIGRKTGWMDRAENGGSGGYLQRVFLPSTASHAVFTLP